METLESLEDVQNLPDGLKTFLCDTVQDLIAVEKELNENPNRKYKDVVKNLVIYNPFHPHYSSPDVISTFADKGKRKFKAIPQNTLKSMFFSEFLLTLTEMFEGLQSDYVVFIKQPPDQICSYKTALLESFAIKGLYLHKLTSRRGELKVILLDANNLQSKNIKAKTCIL